MGPLIVGLFSVGSLSWPNAAPLIRTRRVLGAMALSVALNFRYS